MSINTDFDECHGFDDKSTNRTASNAYINRLKQMISNYQQKIKQNAPMIDTLQKQCALYKKICHKQKEKVQTNSKITIKMMSQDYQQQIDQLNQDKIRIQQMLVYSQEQGKQKQKDNQEILQKLKDNEAFLLNSIKQMAEQMVVFDKIIKDKKIVLDGLRTRWMEGNEVLKKKQVVEHKYRTITSKIQQLQQKKNSSKMSKKEIKNFSPMKRSQDSFNKISHISSPHNRYKQSIIVEQFFGDNESVDA